MSTISKIMIIIIIVFLAITHLIKVHAANILRDFSKCACSHIPETCPLCQTYYVNITLLMVHAANIHRDFS